MERSEAARLETALDGGPLEEHLTLEQRVRRGLVGRETLGDAEYDRVLIEAAGRGCTLFDDEAVDRFVARHTGCTSLDRLNRSGKVVDDVARAELEAVVEQHAPYREDRARHAALEVRRCLADAWSRGAFAMYERANPPENLGWTHEQMEGHYRMSAGTAVGDRVFQFFFSSAAYPELDAMIAELEELKHAVDQERLAILDRL